MTLVKVISKCSVVMAVMAGFCLLAQDATPLSTPTAMARAVKKVAPTFPVAARQLKISGQQEVSIVVSPQGAVTDAKVVKGNAMFTASSVSAAKQWKFTPYVKDGQPTSFSTTLIFNYQL